jgi:hypothetical protein
MIDQAKDEKYDVILDDCANGGLQVWELMAKNQGVPKRRTLNSTYPIENIYDKKKCIFIFMITSRCHMKKKKKI